VLLGLENSIERSPLQLVAAQDGYAAPLADEVQQSTTAQKSADEPVASAVADDKVAPGTIPRASFLGQRLGLALGDMVNWASSWLLGQGKESPAPAVGARVSLDESAPASAPADDKSAVVPESVARRFLKVEREYYFQDRTPAFSDRGNKLATRGTDPEVVRSLVEIAKARGWETIAVKGTEDFRRGAWLEATQSGLTVIGYKPTALDLADVANRPASNTVEKGAVQEKRSVPKQPPTQQPPTQQPPTQRPSAQANSAQPATARQAAPNVPGDLRRDPELTAKATAFQEDKPTFVVKKYPDLAAAYGIVAAAKAFAADKLPEDARDEFVNMARRHMIEKIMAGEQIQGPKIYLAPTKTTDVGNRTKTAEAGVDKGKLPRAKAVKRER
jgi:hypothetical protein